MKFSVVIPVLNGAATIRDCLDSILAQPGEAEIIVIDGGSTDETLDILTAYGPRIACLESGQDSGIAHAMNLGIARATGNVIAILNSDDYWEQGSLPHVQRAFDQTPRPDVVHGRCRFVHLDGTTYVKKPNLPAMRRYMSAYHCTMFVTKEAYQQFGIYDQSYRYAMDAEWAHRALQQGAEFAEVPRVLCNMRMGGESDRSFLSALREYRRSVLTHHVSGRLEANAFLVLHLAVKMARLIPGVNAVKLFLDSRFNDTVYR